MHDHAHRQAEHLVDRAHPLGVAAGQVIVDGDDVHAAAGQGIQVGGQRGDQRFAFAGFHFGDFAFVQDDAADQLHVEMAHAERAAAGFAHQRKGRDNGRLERIVQVLFVVWSSGSESFRRPCTSALSFAEFRNFAVGEFFISGSSALIAATSGWTDLTSRSCFVPIKRATTLSMIFSTSILTVGCRAWPIDSAAARRQ